MPPAAAAKKVLTNTNEVIPGSAESTEPPLKPNQPSHKMSTPAVASGMLCPGMACGFPSLYYPILGPKRHTATKAARPPTEWTNVEPAKS